MRSAFLLHFEESFGVTPTPLFAAETLGKWSPISRQVLYQQLKAVSREENFGLQADGDKFFTRACGWVKVAESMWNINSDDFFNSVQVSNEKNWVSLPSSHCVIVGHWQFHTRGQTRKFKTLPHLVITAFLQSARKFDLHQLSAILTRAFDCPSFCLNGEKKQSWDRDGLLFCSIGGAIGSATTQYFFFLPTGALCVVVYFLCIDDFLVPVSFAYQPVCSGSNSNVCSCYQGNEKRWRTALETALPSRKENVNSWLRVKPAFPSVSLHLIPFPEQLRGWLCQSTDLSVQVPSNSQLKDRSLVSEPCWILHNFNWNREKIDKAENKGLCLK